VPAHLRRPDRHVSGRAGAQERAVDRQVMPEAWAARYGPD
jgi:hypothetical protein